MARRGKPIKLPSKNKISDLCDQQRWLDRRIRSYALLLFPLSLTLACIRILAFLLIPALARLLPANHSRRAFSFLLTILGMRRSWKNHENLQPLSGRPAILVYNHVSLYDVIIIAELSGTALIAADPNANASRFNELFFGWLARGFNMDVRIVNDRRRFVRMLKQWRTAECPPVLCVAPEGTVGNGRGLFAFQKGFFSLGVLVIPLAIRVNPAFPIAMHPVLSHHAWNFLWPLILPWTEFELEFLQPMSIARDQSSEEFAKQVQTEMANHLGISATDICKTEKAAYRQKLRSVQSNVNA